MYYFEKETILPCSVEEAFLFHLNPENLTRISPPWIKTRLFTQVTDVNVGSVVNVEAKRFGISMLWKVRIKEIKKPELLVDEALKSPFKYWSHAHIFEPHEEGARMRDSVRFEMPFGWFGALFGGFVKKDLEKMFAYRHDMTQKLLEKRSKELP